MTIIELPLPSLVMRTGDDGIVVTCRTLHPRGTEGRGAKGCVETAPTNACVFATMTKTKTHRVNRINSLMRPSVGARTSEQLSKTARLRYHHHMLRLSILLLLSMAASGCAEASLATAGTVAEIA